MGGSFLNKLELSLLLIDNYDSFTYNLVHYFEDLNVQIDVVRNDHTDILEKASGYDAIVLSPGPGIPSEAGKMPALIKEYFLTKPILGICLGHQALVEHFEGTIVNLERVFHGVSTTATHNGHRLFNDINNPFDIGRYHSWCADRTNFPEQLSIIATDEHNQIMGCAHNHLPIYGVQFHPESVMTPKGKLILKNFIDIVRNAS